MTYITEILNMKNKIDAEEKLKHEISKRIREMFEEEIMFNGPKEMAEWLFE